jgi:hypothetical protein
VGYALGKGKTSEVVFHRSDRGFKAKATLGLSYMPAGFGGPRDEQGRAFAENQEGLVEGKCTAQPVFLILYIGHNLS